MADENATTSNIELATELAVAWLGNPNVRAGAEEVPAFLRNIHATLIELSTGTEPGVAGKGAEAVEYRPAVSVRSSIKPDYLVSLIDGKPYKLLKRHLAGHGLTPDAYRQHYGLRPDDPMMAPDYAEARRSLARSIGLGRKGGRGRGQAAAPAAGVKPASGRGVRRKAAPAGAD